MKLHESRRRALTTALFAACALAPMTSILPSSALAAGQETADMPLTLFINALRLIGKPVCTDASNTLETSARSDSEFNLHLRNAGLNVADAQILSTAMQRSTKAIAHYLSSFSASYNPELGDTGTVLLAESFPITMKELGMVGCSIGDVGGSAILTWAENAPGLQMICVEENHFSADIRMRFQALASQRQNVRVVV